MTSDMHDLAAAYGVDTAYWGWQGGRVAVSDDTLRAVLAAFGLDTSTDEACAAALADARRRAAERVLPPCTVAVAGEPTPLPTGAYRIEFEDGTTRELGTVDALPADLPLGYHAIVAGDQRAHLVVAPARLDLPDALRERPRAGVATQLYSVRSRGSWGVGDLADLRALAAWSQQHGADFVLVNPLHAAEVVAPVNPSPYLPASRLFANPIYLRIEDVPEYAALDAAGRAAIDRLGDVARAAGTDRVERDPAWQAKLAALARLHAAGLAPDRAAAFDAFRQRQGDALTRFATWCALSEAHGGDWREWPAELRDPASPAVQGSADRARVEFFERLQWWTDEQLARAQQAALGAGMAVGIVHDVAVGVSPAGADAWGWQDAMATSCTVGAPPDAYSQLGQDWQQPPWRPDRLAESGYAPLREMFGTVLRHGGGLRVDHVIGLFRLWWIPPGRPALEGTYVHYDPDAMLGVLALEAHRAGAVVIGEDLGNVPPEAHEALRRRGLLGTSILWFESQDGAPRPPERWREYCLASVTTHDLPPTAGYLAGDHVRLRAELGLLTRDVDVELAAAREEQAVWIAELERLGLLPVGGTHDADEITLALHRFLALTPARLRLVALTDMVGERRTQNQPGTVDEYPNWRVPLAGPDGVPLLLEDVIADPAAARLLSALVTPAG